MTDEVFGLDELENASKRKLKETFAKVFSRPKEELKQEAKEYVCKRNPLVTKEWFIDALKKYDKGEKVKYLKDCEIAEYEAYIAGAEPREKRIEELEEISTRLESYYQNQKVRISELEEKNKVLTQNLEDSEIIITSLKAQIEKMKSDVKEEIGFAKNFDELHTYNVLNNLLNRWEIKEK